MELTNLLDKNKNFEQLKANISNQKPTRQLLTGVNDETKSLVIENLTQVNHKPLVLVVKDDAVAVKFYNELNNLLPKDQVFLFPKEDYLSAQQSTGSPHALNQRLNALEFLQQNKAGVVIVPIAGLVAKLAPPELFTAKQLNVSAGSKYDLADFKNELNQLGYHRVNMVEGPGEYASRGDIIDFYPLNAENPFRIEFFDDEVDIIKEFDVTNQKSIVNVTDLTIKPANEFLYQPEMLNEGLAEAKKAIKKAIDPEEQGAALALTEELFSQFQTLDEPEKIGLFADFIYKKAATILDYAENSTVIFDEFTDLATHQKDVNLENETYISTSSLAPIKAIIQQPNLNDFIPDNHSTLFLSKLIKGLGQRKFAYKTEIVTRNVPSFFNQPKVLETFLRRAVNNDQTVVVAMDTEQRAQGVQDLLQQIELAAPIVNTKEITPGRIQIVQQDLNGGFELPDEQIVVLTQREIFNVQNRKTRVRRQALSNAERIKKYTDLKVGDYIVHINHGIGRFVGMTTMVTNGIHQDYISLEYADGGEIFVPVDQLNLIQKYVSSEAKKPKLNRLGGTSWQKTKRRVKAKIEDMAEDLLALYAKRKAEKGFKFAPDDNFQRQFEAEFNYEETPDQLQATKEIKADMEKDKPMDRLLVGDVGFGKTEVAMRAAFKAVDNNKQVAVLVPTTILAQQHFETFVERFKDFPVDIEMISRFKTDAEIKQTIENLKSGKTNIVIGTHRLLSKDLKYKDLGLLIVDEEQRFGVKHKEQIKQIRDNIDVLTLTATPIPRTLHMSMIGARDLSVLETPPTNRYPIQTYVMEQNFASAHQAIEREIKRHGQVFYVHNRVKDIASVASSIAAMNPDANVTFAHGQMPQSQLEEIMRDFSEGKIDVLVTTTIIETGVDLPNVNTMIVEDADTYGLSQLYQLRGRIGRSARVAFAYFMYRPDKALTETGQKRLKAIKDFTELGSGFKIAMQDLSIRGAGDILGKEQHGFIDSVGFDMYTNMLDEAVKSKQGLPITTVAIDQPQINLPIEAYIPEAYIEDHVQKIEIYKRISQANSLDGLADLEDEVLDRFGEYGTEVANLFIIVKIRIIAQKLNITEITTLGKQIIVKIDNNGLNFSGKEIFSALKDTEFKAEINTDEEAKVTTLKLTDDESKPKQVAELISFLNNFKPEIKTQVYAKEEKVEG